MQTHAYVYRLRVSMLVIFSYDLQESLSFYFRHKEELFYLFEKEEVEIKNLSFYY